MEMQCVSWDIWWATLNNAAQQEKCSIRLKPPLIFDVVQQNERKDHSQTAFWLPENVKYIIAKRSKYT